MKFLFNLSGMLIFRAQALQNQAERKMVFGGIACFSVGYVAYGLVKNYVYAELPEITEQTSGWVHPLLDIALFQTLFFLLFVFVPGMILLTNSIPGGGSGFSISGHEYRLHMRQPHWGTQHHDLLHKKSVW